MKKCGLFLAVILVLLWAGTSDALVQFEITCIRGTGEPVTETFTFDAFGGPATVKLWNGSPEDSDAEKVSSSTVAVNGEVIFGPSDFNQNVDYLEEETTLVEGQNTLEVVLKGKPGGQVTIQIIQNVPPAISITNPVNNSTITFATPNITIEFSDDDSGIDLSSFSVQINDADYTSSFDVTDTRATYQVMAPLPSGSNVISATINDNIGYTSTAVSAFTVDSSTEPIQYIFSVNNNDWIFASPGDGTCIEYLSPDDLGILSFSDVVALSRVSPDGKVFFALGGQGGILQSPADGSNSMYFDNLQLGLQDDDQIVAEHTGLDGSAFFAIKGQPDVYESSGDNTYSLFIQNTELDIDDSVQVSCLHIGYDNKIYFCRSDEPGVFQSTGDNTNTPFLTAANLGVLGSIIDGFAILPESVEVFQASLSATPTKGGIPLEVQFSAQIIGGAPPYSIEWDIDGDGTVDDTRESFSCLYQVAGVYGVILTVTDGAGESVSDSVTIYALSAPAVIASASPTSGGVPLDVAFSATVSDPDGTIVLYEWDFDGDGTFDHSDSSTPGASYRYETAGLYHATIRVTDNDDLTATDTIAIAVGASPSATATADPMTGPAPLDVTFTGSGSDPDGTIALYEWDFDGDGIYDWSSTTTGDVIHTYNSAGIFNATFRVTDNDGLIDTDSVLISVSGPPISKPGAFPTSGEAPLTVTFFSNGEDIDGSPEYYDWDFNGDGYNDRRLIASMNTTYTYTQAGTYNATLMVTDNEGLTGTASVPITVTGTTSAGYPTAIAMANPSNGGAPLQVALTGKGADEDGTITKLEWDFDGDGVFDFEDTVILGSTLGDILDAGSYSSPELVDIDNDGDLDLFIGESGGRIYFYRNDGDSSAPVWNSVGYVTDSASSTIDVGSYSTPDFVDIDGDGDFDLIAGNSSGYIYLYPTAGFVKHNYTIPGTYEATLRATDNSGQTATDSVTIRVLETGTPTATADANPTSGDIPLDVSFNGTGSDADGAIVLYEWDFNGDGTYDWSSNSSGSTSYTYNHVGSYVATLRVTDNEGKTSTDSVNISASLGISASRTTIFDPVSGGTGSITSTITDDSTVTVKVIDQSGNVVRTLADNESRTPGTYTDIWDGNDDAGKIVRDGVYYFLIEHTENGETQTFDLRETAQYREVTPNRSWPSTFNPYEEDYVHVTYSISYPAEVSMYFWKRDCSHPGSSIAPVRTMFLREPKNTGSHTEIWDGVDDEGAVVGPWSGGYCITLWTYELPSNAIIITGNTPVLTDVEAKPNFFSPAYNPYGSTEPNYTVVSFNLSEAANVEVKIKNTNGVTVKSFNKSGLPAGANTIIWDGKDFDGSLVKDGSYSISLTATDNDGNRSLPRYAAIIIHY